MDGLHASWPTDMLREIENIVASCVVIKHSTILLAGENVTFEHLWRERILTAEECDVRANSKNVERAASLFGLEQ